MYRRPLFTAPAMAVVASNGFILLFSLEIDQEETREVDMCAPPRSDDKRRVAYLLLRQDWFGAIGSHVELQFQLSYADHHWFYDIFFAVLFFTKIKRSLNFRARYGAVFNSSPCHFFLKKTNIPKVDGTFFQHYCIFEISSLNGSPDWFNLLPDHGENWTEPLAIA